MTRKTIYGIGLFGFVIASAMTLAAIIMPQWISWDRTTYEDCHGSDRYFCSMWRTVGFLMSFAVVLEGMTFVAYITVLGGGRQKRETGWKVLGFLLLLTAVVQCAGMAIVAYLYEDDVRFSGWSLDTSWILCTISWSLMVLSAIGVVASAYILPSEGGYELILEEN